MRNDQELKIKKGGFICLTGSRYEIIRAKDGTITDIFPSRILLNNKNKNRVSAAVVSA